MIDARVGSLRARLAQPGAETSFGKDSPAVPALRLLSRSALSFFIETYCDYELDEHEFIDPNDLNDPDFARAQVELLSQKLVSRDDRRPGVIVLTELGKRARSIVASAAPR